MVAILPPTWQKRCVGKFQALTVALNKGLAMVPEPTVLGLGRWHRDCMPMSSELAQVRRHCRTP